MKMPRWQQTVAFQKRGRESGETITLVTDQAIFGA
jgi:hypothetical protein